MKKEYETPTVEVITFTTPDVITTSSGTGTGTLTKSKTPSITQSSFKSPLNFME